MECPFVVGQKVVCKLVSVAGWAKSLPFECPVVGGVYTIRAINVWPHSILLRFEELHNERWHRKRQNSHANRYRRFCACGGKMN